MVEITKFEMLDERIKLMIFQFFIQKTGNRKCVHVWIGELEPGQDGIMTDKSRIKACVVSNEQTIARKSKKAFKSFLYLGSICNHFIGNSRKIYNFLRNRTFGIYKCIEFVDNLTVLDLHRTDFGNSTVMDGLSGGLKVENDHFISKCALVITAETAFFVVYKICLKAVNDFHALVLRAKHCIGERLNISVVGYCHCRMPHALGRLDHILGRGYCIHSGHIGVQMKLDSLLRRVICSFYLFYFLRSVKLDNKIGNRCLL